MVTAPNTPAQLAADKATIKAALLTADDLPLGYTGAPHDNSSTNDPPKAVQDAFVACSGFPKRLVDEKTADPPHAAAPDFTKGEIGRGSATEVDSSIELDRSSKDISGPMSHLSDPKAAKCFEPLFSSIFQQGQASEPKVSFSKVSVVKLDAGSVGDQSAAFQGHVTISGNGLSIPIEFDLYFVRSGRAVVELTTIGYTAPFDKTLAEKLIKTMIGRLKVGKA